MSRLTRKPFTRRTSFTRRVARMSAALVAAFLYTLTLCLAPSSTDRIAHAQDVPPAFLGFITAGQDGNMWFTETVGRRIDRITPNGTIASFPVPQDEGAIGAITRGPDGALWFTAVRAVGRITVDGRMAFFRLPSGMQPGNAIVSGPDGALWFSTARGDAIVRLTTAGRTRTFSTPPTTSLAFGRDGALWFTDTSGQAVGRLTLAGEVTEFKLPPRKDRDANGVGAPISLVAGPDGALWFTEFARRIGRIDMRGRVTEFPLSNLNCCIPYSIASGPDHALWVTELYGNGVERITLDGHDTQFEFHTPSSGPLGISAGPDGNLWVTATCSNRVVRVTPGGHTVEFPASKRHVTGAYCFRSV